MAKDRRNRAMLAKYLLSMSLVLVTPYAALAGQESTIFRYDGQDFIRENTTLKKEDGTPAVNTKLDRSSPAYEHLSKKQSYSGPAKLFGQTCDAIYAPVIDTGGMMTGAIFVARASVAQLESKGIPKSVNR